MKKFLSVLLACMMVLSCTMSFNVFAEGALTATPENFAETTVSDETELADALAAGGKVVLGNDIEVATSVEIPEGVEATLDLAGFDIIGGSNGAAKHVYALTNRGILTIEDSLSDGEIISRGIYNYADLVLEGGKIDACDGDGGMAINNELGATFVMNGGVVIASYEDGDAPVSGNYDATAIENPAGCKTILNGGEVISVTNFTYAITTSGDLVIPEDSTVVVTGAHGALSIGGGQNIIEGGEFICSGCEGQTDNIVYIYGSDTNVEITGGTFTHKGEEVDADSGAAVVVSGNNAVLNISGGSFTGLNGALSGNANTTVTGGTFLNGAKSQNHYDDVSEYVPEGFEFDPETGNVKELVAKVVSEGDTQKVYATLEEAFANAEENDTITLLTDIALDKTITNTKNITLNLDGKTITGTDNTEKNFSLIDNRGDLTITGNGKMTLTATVNSGWNRYSAVLANNPGGKLTIENGTFEHLGGTDMAYGIDNLTNGKGTYAETIVNDGTIKSTYRGIRQFLNGIEAQNILTINGGTIEGANKSVWMHDPSTKANSGTLTVGENASLKGDIYLFVTAGSTEWPVEVSIAAEALEEGSTVVTGNVPEKYVVKETNGAYGVYIAPVATLGGVEYTSLADALEATKEMSGDVVIELLANAELSYGAREAYGKDDTTSITINGNDNTLTLNQTNSDWSSIGMANADGVFKMNNVNVVKTGYGVPKGAWNTHAINFNVDTEFENVTFDNSIKVSGTSVLTNVDIVEDEEFYGIWIPADAESVTINGGSITATNGGRGIKIADQYVDTPAEVQLTVDGMTFETAKKAAVLVSSTGGADITATNCDISGVEADSVNFAWVDEEWSSSADKVTVNNESAFVEGTIVINNIEDLKAFRDDVNAGNTYEDEFVKLAADIDLNDETWTPIGNKTSYFKGTFDGGNFTISNLNVDGGENQGFFGYADGAVIKNVKIVNATVTGTDCVGAVAGQVYSVSTIDNCHVSGRIQVTGQTNVGGIVGKYYTKVTNSSVIGDGISTSFVKGVYIAEDLEGDNVGGIMGHCGENNNLSGNTVKSITVSGTRKVGGIVGIADQNTDVLGCVVENVVVETTATAEYAESKKTSMSIGGLVGQYQAAANSVDGTVKNSTVSGVTFVIPEGVVCAAGAITGGARGGTDGMLAPSDEIKVTDNNVANVTGATNYYFVKTATLSFYTDGGKEIDPVTKEEIGEIVDLSTYIPTRSGYNFKGWYEDEALKNKVTSVRLDSDKTVYAKWSKRSVAGGIIINKHTLTFDTNEGTEIDSLKANWGTKISLDKYVAEKSGYKFDGWYSDKELTKKVTEITFNKDMTVYAKWVVAEGESVDVKPDYKPPILTDEHYAYIVGREGGMIAPESDITRAEVATIIYRLLDEDERNKAKTKENSFTDVNEDDWFNTAVSTLAGLGLVNGRTADSFAPNAFITRAELATIFARMVEIEHDGKVLFSDVSGHWAESYINEAATAEWIVGFNGLFRADDNITRAEVMTLVNRVLNREPESKEDLLDGMTSWKDNADENAWYYLAVQEATNSHTCEMKADGKHEKWTTLTETPDWSKIEG